MATKAEIDAARQEAEDAKNRGKQEDAYEASLTSTEMAPKPKKDARDAVRGQKGYAKGGVTRADGCCTKGKTKGTMVKMAYGGKAC
jgi:hypothetical protein